MPTALANVAVAIALIALIAVPTLGARRRRQQRRLASIDPSGFPGGIAARVRLRDPRRSDGDLEQVFAGPRRSAWPCWRGAGRWRCRRRL